jgi:hypothetical protein
MLHAHTHARERERNCTRTHTHRPDLHVYVALRMGTALFALAAAGKLREKRRVCLQAQEE